MPGAGNEYRDQLRVHDFDIDAADITFVAGVWTEIGHYDIPNGIELMLGYGQMGGQAAAAGRIYGSIVVAAATIIAGKLRFELRNPANRPILTLAEFSSNSLVTSATDRQQQVPFPEISEVASERWIIAVMFNADAAEVLDHDGATLALNVDVTVRDLVAR